MNEILRCGETTSVNPLSLFHKLTRYYLLFPGCSQKQLISYKAPPINVSSNCDRLIRQSCPIGKKGPIFKKKSLCVLQIWASVTRNGASIYGFIE